MINYPFEIPPDTQQDLLSETILSGDLYRRLGGGLDPHILSVGDVTIGRRKRPSAIFLSSLVQVSTCRYCCCWSTVNSWETSWQQPSACSLVRFYWHWRAVVRGLEGSRSADNLRVLVYGCCCTSSRCRASVFMVVDGRAAWPWLIFKAGFTVVKSPSKPFNCYVFAHRAFGAFYFQISTTAAALGALILFFNSFVKVRELCIF